MINEFASPSEPDAPPGRRLRRTVLRGLTVASIGALAAPLLGAAAAYATTFTPEDASPAMFLAPSGDQTSNAYFAEGVALDSAGTLAVVGAAGYNSGVGRVYVYSLSGSTWSPVASLDPPGGQPSSWFGHAVAISPDGNEIVVGAPGANSDAGLAYVYSTTNDTWSSTSAGVALSPSAGSVAAYDAFGTSVAISNSTAGVYTIAVGAPANQSATVADPDGGSVHVFTGIGTAFAERTILNDSAYGNNASTTDGVGQSVAVSGNGSEILVGAPGASAPGTYNDQGMAMVFNSSTWSTPPTPTFINAGATDAEIGFSVALDTAGNVALIGAPDQNGSGSDAGVGSAYVFSSGSGGWSQVSTLTSNDGTAGQDQFGQKVALSGNGAVALVGAPDHGVGPNNAQPKAGAAYLFDSGGTWTTNGPSTGMEWTNASNGQAANNFGFSVALSNTGSTVLVGALDYGGTDSSGNAEANVGAAYGLAYTPLTIPAPPGPAPAPTPSGSPGSSGSSGSNNTNTQSTATTTTTVAPAPVLKAATFTKLALAVTFSHKTISVVHGKFVDVRVVLRGTSGYANGRIVVRNGKKAMCSPKLSKGVAVCRLATSSLAIGRHSLKVTFAGGVTYAAFTDSVILKVLR